MSFEVEEMFTVEVKAKCQDLPSIKAILKKEGGIFLGQEEQVDIYFKITKGRLKLRKGAKQSYLIYYEREDLREIRPSHFELYPTATPTKLEKLLRAAFDVLVEVKKNREVVWIQNIKFNLDNVEGLGTFIEIEAMTESPQEFADLKQKVQVFIEKFAIKKEEIQSQSYSDLLLQRSN
ncbi:MAG: class IV adenylate cyclase [Candidatus Heimdallarchaeota archaeon]|nr:class IV adenylate cyclase [Candidatus Heimdallarchaeota archaeon]